MPLDTKSFKRLDWVVLATGVISLIALFLPWWGVSVGALSASVSGWNTSYGWLGGLLVVLGSAWYVLGRAGVERPDLPVPHVVASVGVSGLGLLIILLRWVTLPSGGYLGRTFNYGSRAGIWIAAIAAAVQFGALVVAFRQSGEKLPWASSGDGGKSV